ncbi:HNH endonuclease [Bosea lathyri]|uniref:HNH endonuclease n=1 Tax=Bosea lathyri TaxID=1036778 RepID=A0A1H6C893_9HYPH|nr:hypothetical protein [Bosea lathyri]SEG69194.1 hypothetical protein SAMN04488115_109126 [Bosea lathyri]
MLKLDPPNRTARESFVACVSRVRDAGLRARLDGVENAIAASSAAFEIAAVAQSLHQIARHTMVGGTVSRAEMEAVYVQRMAKKGAPGRAIYEELISAPAHGRCPICAQRSVTTLDHHLPKAHYPALAVAPLNLVPSCSDCNKAKLAGYPRTAIDVTLHPYFDDVDAGRWLFAEVVQTRPTALRFYANAPAALGAPLTDRLSNHFVTFDLGRLYAAEAAEELLNVRHQLAMLHDAGGADDVRAHLEGEAESRRRGRRNGWRTATYEAWAHSDWFCGGGFAPIG